MNFQSDPTVHAGSRRLADSNRCFDARHVLREKAPDGCEWCGAETTDLQEHPRLGILVCAECCKPPEQKPPVTKVVAKQTWIYFIQAGGPRGPVKIGVADDPVNRLLELQTGNHRPLRLIGKVRGTVYDESALHREFRSARIRGEWFRASDELLAWAEGLGAP